MSFFDSKGKLYSKGNVYTEGIFGPPIIDVIRHVYEQPSPPRSTVTSSKYATSFNICPLRDGSMLLSGQVTVLIEELLYQGAKPLCDPKDWNERNPLYWTRWVRDIHCNKYLIAFPRQGDEIDKYWQSMFDESKARATLVHFDGTKRYGFGN